MTDIGAMAGFARNKNPTCIVRATSSPLSGEVTWKNSKIILRL
jgi:hypothetical protein